MYSSDGLSNDRLKIIAAVSMAVDHIGSYLFPQITLLRIIGRISFPIFAFMIAEGCRYTKNKKRYLFNMATLAVICYMLFYTVSSPKYLRVPFTFTVSVILIYLLDSAVTVFYSQSTTAKKCIYAAVLLGAIILVRELNETFVFDYGFYGCMAPVLVSAVGISQKDNENTTGIKLMMLAVALWFIYQQYSKVQIYSFLAIPLLYIYNGKRENIVSKYFFYIFYPLHLAVIFAVKYLILT